MVRQQRRTDRSFVSPADAVTQVRFPVSQRRQTPPHQASHRKCAGVRTGCPSSRSSCSSSSTEEQRGDPGPDGGPGETKRPRLDGSDQAAALTNRERVQGSCGQPGSESGSPGDVSPPDQQGAAEQSEDSRAELQPVASLTVTIQRSSESREFGQTDRTSDRQTGGLKCHVCGLTCRSAQLFQEHMVGSEHLKKLKEITQSISLSTHTLQDGGRRPDDQRWCDTCQSLFSGDVIIHRRTKQHKASKQLSRPFCPVCRRHFRTPRKFVEHMKSAEHKEQVLLQEAQEEELITVDAVGCFEGEEQEEQERQEKEEDEEEEEEAQEEAADVVDEEEDGDGDEEAKNVSEAHTQGTHMEEYDPNTIYGSSFVVPVSGFLCRLCNKFFYRETTARHTHCRTHTHYLNMQGHRVRRCDERT